MNAVRDKADCAQLSVEVGALFLMTFLIIIYACKLCKFHTDVRESLCSYIDCRLKSLLIPTNKVRVSASLHVARECGSR